MFMRRCSVRRLLAVGFVFLLTLPTMQMQWRFIKEAPLGGVEQSNDIVNLSVPAWWDGSAESAISDWAARRIGFRAICVRVINQSKLVLNSAYELPVPDQLTIGKDHWLYETDYVQRYAQPQGVLPESEVEEFVTRLRTLQTMLAERGTTFLLVISPSKTELYPEYLPEAVVKARQRFSGRRDYDVLVERLARQRVNFIDAPKLLRELKPKSEPLCSRTGTHWNYYACFLVWCEALKKINTCSSRHLPVPELAGIEYDKPRGTDNDLGSLLNVFVQPGGTPRVPYPIVKAALEPVDAQATFLFVGTSFTWTLVDAMYMSHSSSQCDVLYYSKSHFHCTNNRPALRPGDATRRKLVCSLDDSSPDWSQILFSKSVVVLEVLETHLEAGDRGFCQRAMQALQDLPRPYPSRGSVYETAQGQRPASRE